MAFWLGGFSSGIIYFSGGKVLILGKGKLTTNLLGHPAKRSGVKPRSRALGRQFSHQRPQNSPFKFNIELKRQLQL